MPAPPVARMVWGAWKVSTSSVSSSSAYRPTQRFSPACPSLVVVIRSTSVWCSNSVTFGLAFTFSIRVCCTAAPVASVTWTMRRALWPPSRVRCSWPAWPASSENGTPSFCNHAMDWGAFSTTNCVAFKSHRPAPAMSVSSTWAAKLSSLSHTAAMPPCAQPLLPSRTARLVRMATLWVDASSSAALSPARPLPTMSTSKDREVEVEADMQKEGWLGRAH